MSYSRILGVGAAACVALGLIVSASTADAAGRVDPGKPIFSWLAKPKTEVATSKEARHDRYTTLISKYARANGVPVSLAHAIVRVESNFNARARGGAGEIGLMQIKPSTARMIGYSGKAKSLYDPATNLQWGMKYLGTAHQLAGGDTCGTVLRYNAGHYAKRMNPISARYCRKVKTLLKTVTIKEKPERKFLFVVSHGNR